MDVVKEILQTVLSGISIGCVYGLVALGFVLIFKATEVINFAQGELLMLGAFISYSLITMLNFPYWAALLLTVIFMGLFGALLERTVLQSTENTHNDYGHQQRRPIWKIKHGNQTVADECPEH